MNVIPTALAPPAAAATGTAGVPSTDGTDACLADAFAALVDSLVAQLDGEATEDGPSDADGEVAAPADGEAEDSEASLAGTVAAPVLLVWPTPPATLDGSGAPTSSDALPAAPSETVSIETPTGVPLIADAEIEALAAELAPTSGDTDPSGGDGAEPATVDHEAVVDGQGDLAPTGGDDPDIGSAEQRPAAPAAATPSVGADAGDAAPAPAGGVNGPTSVRPADDVAATAPAAQAAAGRAPAPSLPDQLVEVIGPLRQSPDGTHRVSVHLRPDELGEVLVDVRVRGNEVNLSIRADLAGTADLLREALGELRAELEAAGFRSGDVDVSSHADRGPADERRATGAPAGDAGSTELADGSDDEVTPETAPSAANSGLDVRL